MPVLNLDYQPNHGKGTPRKPLKLILGICASVSIIALGSTLAANISLNGGGNVEFGQGVSTTAVCDSDITLTPVSEFSNTEEGSMFAMTAIQVSNIDLTPEGWDETLNDRYGGWADGFNYQSHSWEPGSEMHAGQYRDGSGNWINTCENKVLMLRAYTDNYPEKTVNNNVNSPLYVTGSNAAGRNAGVGFRIPHNETQNNWNSWFVHKINSDNGNGYESSAFSIVWNLGGNFGNESTVTINLDEIPTDYPPLDSRWVDKLTVESSATIPSDWVWND